MTAQQAADGIKASIEVAILTALLERTIDLENDNDEQAWGVLGNNLYNSLSHLMNALGHREMLSDYFANKIKDIHKTVDVSPLAREYLESSFKHIYNIKRTHQQQQKAAAPAAPLTAAAPPAPLTLTAAAPPAPLTLTAAAPPAPQKAAAPPASQKADAQKRCKDRFEAPSEFNTIPKYTNAAILFDRLMTQESPPPANEAKLIEKIQRDGTTIAIGMKVFPLSYSNLYDKLMNTAPSIKSSTILAYLRNKYFRKPKRKHSDAVAVEKEKKSLPLKVYETTASRDKASDADFVIDDKVKDTFNQLVDMILEVRKMPLIMSMKYEQDAVPEVTDFNKRVLALVQYYEAIPAVKKRIAADFFNTVGYSTFIRAFEPSATTTAGAPHKTAELRDKMAELREFIEQGNRPRHSHAFPVHDTVSEMMNDFIERGTPFRESTMTDEAKIVLDMVKQYKSDDMSYISLPWEDWWEYTHTQHFDHLDVLVKRRCKILGYEDGIGFAVVIYPTYHNDLFNPSKPFRFALNPEGTARTETLWKDIEDDPTSNPDKYVSWFASALKHPKIWLPSVPEGFPFSFYKNDDFPDRLNDGDALLIPRYKKYVELYKTNHLIQKQHQQSDSMDAYKTIRTLIDFPCVVYLMNFQWNLDEHTFEPNFSALSDEDALLKEGGLLLLKCAVPSGRATAVGVKRKTQDIPWLQELEEHVLKNDLSQEQIEEFKTKIAEESIEETDRRVLRKANILLDKLEYQWLYEMRSHNRMNDLKTFEAISSFLERCKSKITSEGNAQLKEEALKICKDFQLKQKDILQRVRHNNLLRMFHMALPPDQTSDSDSDYAEAEEEDEAEEQEKEDEAEEEEEEEEEAEEEDEEDELSPMLEGPPHPGATDTPDDSDMCRKGGASLLLAHAKSSSSLLAIKCFLDWVHDQLTEWMTKDRLEKVQNEDDYFLTAVLDEAYFQIELCIKNEEMKVDYEDTEQRINHIETLVESHPSSAQLALQYEVLGLSGQRECPPLRYSVMELASSMAHDILHDEEVGYVQTLRDTATRAKPMERLQLETIVQHMSDIEKHNRQTGKRRESKSIIRLTVQVEVDRVADMTMKTAQFYGQSSKNWLFPWQLANMERFRQQYAKNQGLIIADEPGCGKTASALACASLTRKIDKTFRVLICCPAAVMTDPWKENILEWTEFDDIAFVNSAEAKNAAAKSAKFCICSYNAISNGLNLANLGDFTCVIFDEAHEINPTRLQKLSPFLGENQNIGILLLTGTPIVNNRGDMSMRCQLARVPRYDEVKEWVNTPMPEEQPAIVGTIDGKRFSFPKETGLSFITQTTYNSEFTWEDDTVSVRTYLENAGIGFHDCFVFEEYVKITDEQVLAVARDLKRYPAYRKPGSGPPPPGGPTALQLLPNLMCDTQEPLLAFAHKTPDLPDDIERLLQYLPREEKTYTFKDVTIEWRPTSSPESCLDEIVNHGKYGEFIRQVAFEKVCNSTDLEETHPKIAKIMEVAKLMHKDIYNRETQETWAPMKKTNKTTGETRKVVIFSESIPFLQLLAGIFNHTLETKSEIYQGEGARGVEVLAKFKTDDQPYLFVSMMAGSLGLDMRFASGVIFASCDWTAMKHKQSIGRCWRIGQKRDVCVAFILPHQSSPSTTSPEFQKFTYVKRKWLESANFFLQLKSINPKNVEIARTWLLYDLRNLYRNYLSYRQIIRDWEILEQTLPQTIDEFQALERYNKKASGEAPAGPSGEGPSQTA
jgi:SNF2 family DNA or RNA helicase